MVCGLLYVIWAAGYKGCSICSLFNVMCVVVWYVGFRMVCGLLNCMWAVVSYVGSCMVCGLSYCM